MNKRWYEYQDNDDLITPGALLAVATMLDPWLPRWMQWVLTAPFVLAIVLAGMIEYALRWLLTPSKFWRGGR